MSKVRYLTMKDRLEIERMWNRGYRAAEIAHELGLSVSVAYNELRRGRTGKLNAIYKAEYDPVLAEKIYQESIAGRGPRGPRKAKAQ